MTAPWFADERLASLARGRPDDLAIVEAGGAVVTWRDLEARAASAARLVLGEGLGPGDRVALQGDPGADLLAAILGVLRAGAIAAPVPAGLTGRELAATMRVLAPALVLRPVDLAGRDDRTPSAPVARDPEAPAVVVLTSGTTGRPKGVVLSARALAASADAWLAALPRATGWILALGLAHVAGLGVAWRALRDGVPLRVVDRADVPGLWRAILAEPAPSHVSLVPAQLARVLDASDARPPETLRAVLLGGGPIAPALVTRALEGGWPVVPTYGLSETASGATALATAEARAHPASAGRPLPGVALRIDDPGPDGVGEIVVTTDARSSGYLGDPAPVLATEPVHTGDLGRLDEDGRLVVADRRLDRIVRGGENVAPAEVEAVLLAHPAVADAAVVARPHAELGHEPVAAIVLRDPARDPGDEALAAHARAGLAGFKVPVAFARLDTLPRTPGGKLRRDAVRALLAGERSGELARPGGDAIGWRVTGAGPEAVLLLHGTLSTAGQLDRLAAALATDLDATVHAIDRRGSGTSRHVPAGPVDAATHVGDLVAYLDARGLDRATVVGHSFGGVLGLELAARHPERVRAVVVYEPPYGLVGDEATVAWFHRVARDTADAHAEGGPAAAAETFLRAVAGDAAWDRLPDRARGFLEGEGDGAFADVGLTGLDPDGLARIACPVTILTGGASDAFYTPLADELARRIPGARRDTLPGLAHPAPITAAAAVAAAVRACLEPIA